MTEEEVRSAAEALGLTLLCEGYLSDLLTAHEYAASKVAQLPRQHDVADEPAHVFRLPTETT